MLECPAKSTSVDFNKITAKTCIGAFTSHPRTVYAQTVPSAGSSSDTTEEQWREKNERRLELIDKDLAGRLSPRQRQELSQLENEIDAHVERIAPLPFAKLEELEDYVRRTRPPRAK